MSFTFNDGIPAANNNPSFDQPEMLQNNISNALIWNVDHIGFNDASNEGGSHVQNTYYHFSAPSNPVGTPASVAYPAGGVGDATHAQYYFRNSLTSFIINAVKAWGSFIVTSSGNTLLDNFNCASLSTDLAGTTSTITMNVGTTGSNNYTILPFITGNQSISYSITGTNTFNITNNAGGVGQRVSFIVLQA